MFIKKNPFIFFTKNLTKNEYHDLLSILQNQIKTVYYKNPSLEKNKNDKSNILDKVNKFDKNNLQNEKNKLKCPRCGHDNLNKNGITNNRQRYICKNCRKTFDQKSFSPLSNTKLSLDKWLSYCHFMLKGGTLKYCAQKIDVSIPTSFFMRHKILDILNFSLRNQTFTGVIATDNYNLNESFKGKSSKKNIEEDRFFHNFKHKNWSSCFGWTYRNSNYFVKHPEKYINLIQVKINTAIDKNGHILSRIIENPNFMPYSKEKYQDLFDFFDGKVDKNATLCAFKGAPYPNVALKLNIKFKQARNRMPQKPFSVHHVFMYHKKLSKWLKYFNGVATKYLNNYLSWFSLLFMFKNIKFIDKIQNLFTPFILRNLSLTKKQIQNRIIEFI